MSLLRRTARPLRAALLAAAALGAPGAAAAPREHDVKAAFLVHFARFVEWPQDAAPRVIVVVEPDPFGRALDAAASDATLAAPLSVRRVGPGETVPPCRIVFAGRDAGSRGALAALSAGPGTLSVGETEEFLARGGILRLAVVEGRVRIEINMDAADRSGLKLSSQLLRVATLRREEDLR